ncbi:hypothetical protein FQN52_008973 [Onygenales sp. PD_12]|nr:hypothetical protein FQN52_008973 [Onygenales sp. PD_12]KAK2799316.1 hypothetical protein FQN51_006993 [Onygenales sp. PD_10]
MVIDLTRDSSDEESFHSVKETPPGHSPQSLDIHDESQRLLQRFTRDGAQNGSLALLQRFTRPKPSQPSPSPKDISPEVIPTLSRRESSSRHSSSSASNTRPLFKHESPSKEHAIAVVIPRSSISDSSSVKRRRLSSTTSEIGKVNGQGFPFHHGLSPFYSTETQNVPAYRPKKLVDREKAALGGRPVGRYHPSRGGSDSLLSLYKKKLALIAGPRVTLDVSPEDAAKIDFNFEFINEYKLQDGVKRVEDGFLAGCNCEGGVCDANDCSHLSCEEDSDDVIHTYGKGRDGMIVLRRDFLNRISMIFECSPKCPCPSDCWNRVVQRGRTLELEIFRTKNSRGFGLRSRQDIQAGQYIDKYLGEVITKKEADAREAAVSGGAASYLFSLDFLVRDDSMYIVDGRKYGSVTRFMNHSCHPNCKMFPVAQYDAEQRIFDMAFFAIKDIPAGTELTFDYCPNYKASSKVDPDAVKCLCGERNCRGQLWPNQRKTMKLED